MPHIRITFGSAFVPLAFDLHAAVMDILLKEILRGAAGAAGGRAGAGTGARRCAGTGRDAGTRRGAGRMMRRTAGA